MKTLKTPFGIKRIEDSDQNAFLFQLGKILSEHRAILISRLLADLPTYIHYKFQVKASAKQLKEIKEGLLGLKNASIELDKYPALLNQVYAHDDTVVTAAPFYKEIDEYIGGYVREPQFEVIGSR